MEDDSLNPRMVFSRCIRDRDVGYSTLLQSTCAPSLYVRLGCVGGIAIEEIGRNRVRGVLVGCGTLYIALFVLLDGLLHANLLLATLLGEKLRLQTPQVLRLGRLAVTLLTGGLLARALLMVQALTVFQGNEESVMRFHSSIDPLRSSR